MGELQELSEIFLPGAWYSSLLSQISSRLIIVNTSMYQEKVSSLSSLRYKTKIDIVENRYFANFHVSLSRVFGRHFSRVSFQVRKIFKNDLPNALIITYNFYQKPMLMFKNPSILAEILSLFIRV